MLTDPAISGFLAAVDSIHVMLDWLKAEANLSSGSTSQLRQLAAALSNMDGYSDNLVMAMLNQALSQVEQCCHLLTFLGSGSAMQLHPVAQIAAELRRVVALGEVATAQQIQHALNRSQGLFPSLEDESFVKHFAAKDSALFDAYLQHSWQHEIGALLEAGG